MVMISSGIVTSSASGGGGCNGILKGVLNGGLKGLLRVEAELWGLVTGIIGHEVLHRY